MAEKENKKPIRITFAIILALYGLLTLIFAGTGEKNFDNLHIALDSSNGMLSAVFAIFVWTTIYQKKGEHHFQPYLSIAFAFAATMEILHALVGIEWMESFSWITQVRTILRPATWPPSTYLLPIALTWTIWIIKSDKRPALITFIIGLTIISSLLLILFFHLPPYKEIGLLSIQRPFQIPVLPLLAGVGYLFWQMRGQNPLFETLAYSIVFLFISDIFMLYSTSPNEKWATVGHFGKFLAYFLLHIGMMVQAKEDMHQLKERLNYLSYFDELTGLANSTLFHNRLSQALALAKRNNYLIAVLFLDLDRVKLINDSLGRHIGDLLIKGIGERLLISVRATDSVVRFAEEPSAETVARMGGDEFIILLPTIAKVEDVAGIAVRALKSLSQPFTLEGHQMFVTGSIGISLYPEDGDSNDILVQNASAAMFSVKQQGGNNFQYYSSEINAKSVDRLKMETGLRYALEQDQFVLYYEPQVDLETGQIIGMEALIRWQHPDRGMILPGQFIPLAEETGLIIQMGKWILKTACLQNKAWQEAGLSPISIAVNISARQFEDKHFAEMVSQVINETGLDPRFLELELTESIMQKTEKTIVILNQCREKGIQISIDDFGTGYSSLSYLKRLPIHKLKIDQAFVRNILSDLDDAAIVNVIITLAQTLKLRTIAEGVETKEQLEYLRSKNCNEIQGYLFSKPLSACEATKLLANKCCLGESDMLSRYTEPFR